MHNRFDFWHIDFRKMNVKNNLPAITKCDNTFINALRITKSQNLVVEYGQRFNGSSKSLHYVPFDFWNSSSSPVWFPTNKKKYGFMIREKVESISSTELLGLISVIESKEKN